jgi:hypothetical protein
MDLESLGHAAATFQRDPRLIANALWAVQAEAAAAAARPIPHEATPTLRLNGIPYFLADEVVAAIGWMAKNDAEKLRAKAEAAGHE